jgi:hypothetical protein
MTMRLTPFVFSYQIVKTICKVLNLILSGYPPYIHNLLRQLDLYTKIHYQYKRGK